MFLFSLSPLQMLVWVLGFLQALTVHEAAHAAVANWLGDPTARLSGRVSLNPARHLDPAGTLFLIFVGFGWGRPVPVNPANFANPRVGELLTALAGPLANLCAAFLLAIPYNFWAAAYSPAADALAILMSLNIILFVFNLLPLPPLDGGGAVAQVLPLRWREQFLQHGPFLLFGVLAFDFAFKTDFLRTGVMTVANMVWTGVNLATRFGG